MIGVDDICMVAGAACLGTLAAFLGKPEKSQAQKLKEVWENTNMVIKRKSGNGQEQRIEPKLVKEIKTGSGHRFIVSLPPGASPEDVRQREAAIGFALGAEVELSDNGKGEVFIDTFEYDLPKRVRFNIDPQAFIAAHPDMILPIPIGYSRAGLEVRDLSEFPHFLVPGQTFGGKSVFVHQMLAVLAHNPRARLFLIDMAKLELSTYKRHAWFAGTLEKAIEMLEYLHAEMFRRMDVLDRAGVVKIQDYGKEDMPFFVLVLEEFSQLSPVLAKGDKEKKADRERAHSLLVDIICLARKVGIHVVITTQRPDKDILPGQLKANIPATVCFKVRNEANSRICLDNDKAFRLPPIKGRGIFQFDVERQVQVMFLKVPEQARKLLPKVPVTKPQRPAPPPAAPPPDPF